MWCVSCSEETESVPFLETEETLEAETTLEDSTESDPYDSEEYRELMERREQLNTEEAVHQWREDLNEFYDTYFGEIDEPESEPSEPAPEPVTLVAEYDYGEVRTEYEGDFNDDVTIELKVNAEFEKREYRTGEEFEIHIVVENAGDAFMYLNDYSEPSGTFQYRCDTEKGYTTYRISPHFEERPLPDAVPSDELAETGHLWGARYTYMIPEIIPKEKFDLYINFRGYQAVIRDAIEIIE